jgi:hypothetical protein
MSLRHVGAYLSRHMALSWSIRLGSDLRFGGHRFESGPVPPGKCRYIARPLPPTSGPFDTVDSCSQLHGVETDE